MVKAGDRIVVVRQGDGRTWGIFAERAGAGMPERDLLEGGFFSRYHAEECARAWIAIEKGYRALKS